MVGWEMSMTRGSVLQVAGRQALASFGAGDLDVGKTSVGGWCGVGGGCGVVVP
jgi:hypothetical protein